MAKGYALHIGLNKVDPTHYAKSWEGKLRGCENDARAMAHISSSLGYQRVETLLTKDASLLNFQHRMVEYSKWLQSGDIFLLTFSGHGGQKKDYNGDEGESDMDQCWCFYNGIIIDDELYELWKYFAKGVRILVISDSCHSGTIIRDLNNGKLKFANKPSQLQQGMRIRTLSSSRSRAGNYHQQQLLTNSKKQETCEENVQASVRLISACGDQQRAKDGADHGRFTKALLEVWNDGAFEGNYDSFVSQIQLTINQRKQLPNHAALGKYKKHIEAFRKEKPFTI